MPLAALLVVLATACAISSVMAGLGVVALFAAVTDALEATRRRHRARRLDRVSAMADATGLVALIAVRPLDSVLAGRVDGFQVQVRWTRSGWNAGGVSDCWTEVSVGWVAPELTLEPARLPAPLGRVAVGGPAFEARVATTGRPEVARAVLDAHARHVLAQELSRYRYRRRFYRIEVRDGRVRACVQRNLGSGADLQELLARAIRVATALRGDDTPLVERLARNAREDPDPEVRVRCLESLLCNHRGREAFRTAAWALDASDPRARLMAALYLERPVEVIGAVHHLMHGVLAGWGGPGGWHRVRPWAMYVARLVCRLDHPSTVPLLLRLLDAPSNEIRVMALRSLAKHGTVDTIEPLMAYLHRPFPRVRGAARDAIRAIQSRLEGAEAGALSLADARTEVGWLSMSEGRAAAVP